MTTAFSKKQLQILAFPKSDYDALICDGSIRAGKTSVMSVSFILWGMQNFNGKNFGICSKTIRTAERNIIRPLLAMSFLRRRFNIRYIQGERLEVSNGKHTNTFYIFGGKDASSYQLIQGITLAGVLLDEVALMPRSFVDQALARCSITGRKFFFNCNPEAQLHWFNQEWILQPEKHNALHLHFTLDDNPSLDESIKEAYRSMYSGVFYQRYIEGLWVSTEGVIYSDMFDPKENVIKAADAEKMLFEGEPYVSCDFGIQNATVFLLWRKVAGEQRYICTKEFYYSGRDEKRQMTVSELVDGLKTMLNGISPKCVIVDPSASALKVELRKKGFKVMDAKNEVLNGIANTGKLLQDRKLMFSDACSHTIDEFSLYMWDDKASERGEDIPIKENDHAMDALRYFVSTLYLHQKLYKSQIVPRGTFLNYS